MSLTKAETKDARARLRAKHGDYTPRSPRITDLNEHALRVEVEHPSREAAEDWAAFAKEDGCDTHVEQRNDGQWITVYTFHTPEPDCGCEKSGPDKDGWISVTHTCV